MCDFLALNSCFPKVFIFCYSLSFSLVQSFPKYYQEILILSNSFTLRIFRLSFVTNLCKLQSLQIFRRHLLTNLLAKSNFGGEFHLHNFKMIALFCLFIFFSSLILYCIFSIFLYGYVYRNFLLNPKYKITTCSHFNEI